MLKRTQPSETDNKKRVRIDDHVTVHPIEEEEDLEHCNSTLLID